VALGDGVAEGDAAVGEGVGSASVACDEKAMAMMMRTATAATAAPAISHRRLVDTRQAYVGRCRRPGATRNGRATASVVDWDARHPMGSEGENYTARDSGLCKTGECMGMIGFDIA